MSIQTLEQKTSVSSISVEPLAGRIGAEISGVALSGRLPEAEVEAIHQALLQYKVVFFRKQHQFTDVEHQAFGRLFGEIEAHPTVPAPNGTHFLELNSEHGARADSWHTDVTFRATYPKACVLRAVKLPEYGGDTVWANCVAAYESLPASLKLLAEQLWAVHGNDHDYVQSFKQSPQASAAEIAARESYQRVFLREILEAEHPLVHIHPETGEKSLLLGHFAKQINGLRSEESAALLKIFNDRIIRLENTVRWRWAAGDVAMWDNRATQHYGINDYGDARRVVRRVTISGDRAVGVDGRRSADRRKEPKPVL